LVLLSSWTNEQSQSKKLDVIWTWVCVSCVLLSLYIYVGMRLHWMHARNDIIFFPKLLISNNEIWMLQSMGRICYHLLYYCWVSTYIKRILKQDMLQLIPWCSIYAWTWVYVCFSISM
jgi:hypothetical protein